MEKRIGDVWFDSWITNSNVVCVEDDSHSSCEDCAFNDCGGACDAKVYSCYPCYKSDRKDGKSVHYKII